jgi:alpha-beta hydrolase superfamily lysophospholipase
VGRYQPKLEHYIAADGCRLSAHVWDTEASPLARAVFVHGISSHAGWYNRGNEHLAAAGVQVHFLDRRGSGFNKENRGDVDHWYTWISDIVTYIQQLRQSSSMPVSLCGISWGGKLAAAVARSQPELIDALGLICPGIYSPFEPGFVKQLVLRAPVTQRIQRRRIAIPLRDPELFTDNRAWQRFIVEDANTLRDITWRFARENRKLSHFARQAAPELIMPLLLMLAGRDRIIDNPRVIDFFNRAPSPEKSLIRYPKAEHTLEFDTHPQAYFGDLAQWLRKRNASRKGQHAASS